MIRSTDRDFDKLWKSNGTQNLMLVLEFESNTTETALEIRLSR